jgi:hypothetical protein
MALSMRMVTMPVKFVVEMIARLMPPVRNAIMLPNERKAMMGI